MPALQIRNLDQGIYDSIVVLAKEENRSIAQQATVLLRFGQGSGHPSGGLRVGKHLLQFILQSEFRPPSRPEYRKDSPDDFRWQGSSRRHDPGRS